MNSSLTIATPCFNEELSLPTYFKSIDEVRLGLEGAGWQVCLLLIDDGSTDSTRWLLQDYAEKREAVRVIPHPANLGYGAAIKTALAVSSTDWVAFVDADTNYDQRLILELVERISVSVDLVNVSILAPGGGAGYPWYRMLLSSSASALYKLLLPRLTKGVHTMTCGFRLYRRSRTLELMPQADGFVATAEIMLRALQLRLGVVEFPATNSRREDGVSKMKFVRVTLGHVRLALRALLGRLGPPIDPESHRRRIGAPM